MAQHQRDPLESGCARLTHAGGRRLTEFDAKFSEAWPQVGSEVTRRLIRRGFPADWAEDIAQEAGIRALGEQVPFASADDLLPWVWVVARRLALNRQRHEQVVHKHTVVSDQPSCPDADEAARARMALAAVVRELRGLEESDLLLLFGPPGPGAEPNRMYVRRHRLRRHLRQVAAAFLTGAVFGIRPRRAGTATPALVAASVALAMFVAVAPPRHAPTPPAVAASGGVSVAAVGPVGAASAKHAAAMAGAAPVSAGEAGSASERPGRRTDVNVDVPVPAGDDVLIWSGDKEPGEPLVCAQAKQAGHCVGDPGAPVPWTAVETPVPAPEPVATILPSG